MTNFQFISLQSTAIGSFVLVILAWLHQNQRLTDQRIDTQRQFGEVQRQFGEVQRQFGKVRSALATLSADYQNFYGLEQKLEGRVDELSKRIK